MLKWFLSWFTKPQNLAGGGGLTRRGFLHCLSSTSAVVLIGQYVPWDVRPVETDKQRILREFMATPEGRMNLAQSMVQPLRTRIDYQAVGRRVFQVESLPMAAVPVYGRA